MSHHNAANYIPSGIDNQYHWLNNLVDKIAGDLTQFTTVKPLWEDLRVRREDFNAAFNAVHEGRRYLSTLTAAQHDTLNGNPRGNWENPVILPAPNKIFPGADRTMKGGTLPWIAKVFVPKLVSDPHWTESLRPQYGLTPIIKGGGLEYHDFKLDVQKTADQQHLELTGIKGGFEAFQVWRKLDGQKEAHIITTIQHLPWTDPDPLTDQPETREYQLRGVVKNDAYGAPSRIFIITARKTVIIEEKST